MPHKKLKPREFPKLGAIQNLSIGSWVRSFLFGFVNTGGSENKLKRNKLVLVKYLPSSSLLDSQTWWEETKIPQV